MINKLLNKILDSSYSGLVIYSSVIVSSIQGIDNTVLLMVRTRYILLCDLSYILVPILMKPTERPSISLVSETRMFL